MDENIETREAEIYPRLRRQKFGMYKMLSVVCVLSYIFLAFPVGITVYPDSWSVMAMALVAGMGIFIFLQIISFLFLNALRIYVKNFDSSPFMERCTIAVCACIILPVLVIIPTFYDHYNLLSYLIIIATCIIVLSIGIYLYNLKDRDYVGGCKSLGIAMCSVPLLPVFIIVVPFFLYNVFNRAQKYAQIHGCADEEKYR